MKIGFDAKRYFHNYSGLGNYSRDLIDTMIRMYPSNRYYLFDNRPDKLDFPYNTIVSGPGSSGMFWRQLGIMKDIRLHLPDVYHGLSGELPYGKWPSAVRKVVTVHDVIFRDFPHLYPAADRFFYHLKTKHALKCADIVLATSEATKNDINRHYGSRESDIRVIYQTCGAGHWKEYSGEKIEEFREINKLPGRFILYVSSFQTRKNHASLIRAMKITKPEIQMLFAGLKGPELKDCIKMIHEMNLGSRIIIKTNTDSKDLPLLYRAASGFIYPSLTEGFGIPLLEAACAGLPIAFNDIPVFRELAPVPDFAFRAADEQSTARALEMVWDAVKTDYGSFLGKFKPEKQAESLMNLYSEISGK